MRYIVMTVINLKHRIRRKISQLGEYCNEHPGDDITYNIYVFLVALFF